MSHISFKGIVKKNEDDFPFSFVSYLFFLLTMKWHLLIFQGICVGIHHGVCWSVVLEIDGQTSSPRNEKA